ncbi:hypothetical protein DB42_BB00130 [Neochlamydia sp. EPS4]|nr:hypothetical protein DB42_BB00130 [Neochlamydia sp. EPS4]
MRSSPLGKQKERESQFKIPLSFNAFIKHEKILLFSLARANTLMNKVRKIDEQGLARICKPKQGCS